MSRRTTRLTKLRVLNMTLRVWERTTEPALGPNPLIAAHLMEQVHEPDANGVRLSIDDVAAAMERVGTVASVEITNDSGNGIILDFVR